MKINLFIYSAAAAFLCLQSCSKTENVSNRPAAESLKKVNSGTVAYQDNTITNWFKRNSNSLGSVAYDQAFSVPLANGKVLWLFGDTFYNDLDANGKVPCWSATHDAAFNIHNSVLQQPSITNWTQSSTTNLIHSSSAQIYTAYNANGTTNNYFWPCTGIEIGTKVYTYLYKLDGLTAKTPKWGILNETTNAVDTTSTLLPNLNSISFNIGMFKVGTYIYVYGYKTTGVYGNTNIYVARFLPASPGTWTFWNGSSWVSSATSASVIATTTSNGVSVSYINGKYVLIYTEWNFGCGTSDAVYASKSTSATGGFSAPVLIYHIPDRKTGNIPFFYTPLIHPEFTANNEFLFTYCINFYEPCVAACTASRADPDDYRPRAVRVPYIVLGL